jgi:hypothetical protein
MAPPEALTTRGLSRATLARQGLLDPITDTPPGDAVRRLGSLQAQHPDWPPVALAARAADAATADLAGALERRQAVRSSLMRVTIHVVAADDLWPMFAVMRPMRLDQWRLLVKADPITSRLGRRLLAAHATAVAALRERPRSSLELDRLLAAETGLDGTPVTRPAWRDPGARIVVRTAWRHFAAFVPLVHVPHPGEGYGRSQYALASDWVGTEQPEVDPPSARVHLARRYLAAFGPASVEDLAAYVGRGRGGVRVWREAIDQLGDEIVPFRDGGGRGIVDLVDAPRPDEGVDAPPRLLARWDSVLLSHATKHRDRIIDERERPRVFSKNADVLPTFLLDGFVAGTWDLTRTSNRVEATLRPFRRVSRGERSALIDEAERVLALLEPEADRVVRIGR